MERKYHIFVATILIIGLIVEILPIGIVSALSGFIVVVLSSIYAYHLAKSGYVEGFIATVLIQLFAVYLISKPYLHYDINQYVDGKFVGNPHVHRIWDNDHLH